MDAKKKKRGLAYISAIKAILDKMSSESLFENFELNTEHGCVENSLRIMENVLKNAKENDEVK